MFEVVPAIDLRGGLCVRLFQGDFGRETVFSSNPIEVARRWEKLGAARLHVVDLDGARDGAPTQLGLAAEIAASIQLPVQLGGGLRCIEHVAAAFEAGLDRVVLGTAAVADEDGEKARAFRLAS